MDDGSPPPTPAPDDAETADRVVAEAVARIRAHGERVTVARTAVLRVLADTSGFLTADQIFAEVNRAAPGVHRTTIYRALDALERLGLVVQTRMGQDAATYQLGEAGTYVHLVCRDCGRVERAPGDLLDPVAADLVERSGFRLIPTGAALTGVCRSCFDSLRYRKPRPDAPTAWWQ
ncbi:Fur family transcriptional regulator [Yinghuangia seranimata]|uniref:Fur family transcriptional regulator n=1 Tax=Yinghuangia seranimata TaxID=408067 RepID=UPI00248BC5DC|nr:Fur family transcriptional regulator [Yinghuangia seranimata]MDI2125765.1 Fur family transcriptional regulator [Yinghuangia seranimata]